MQIGKALSFISISLNKRIIVNAVLQISCSVVLSFDDWVASLISVKRGSVKIDLDELPYNCLVLFVLTQFRTLVPSHKRSLLCYCKVRELILTPDSVKVNGLFILMSDFDAYYL